MILMVVLGAIMGYISIYSAQEYYEEANQKLNKELAQFTTDHLETFNENQEIDTTAIQDLMHSMMVINPNVEVYLLNPEGTILTHVAPYKKVVRSSVSLDPIHHFINNEGDVFIKGDDPRDFNKTKTFSAAPIIKESQTLGYYYIILASEERTSVLASHSTYLASQLACKLIILCIAASILLGFSVFWFQTKNLGKIVSSVEEFERGNLNSRISDVNSGTFGLISSSFNNMAATIQSNIQKIESVEEFRKELIANVSHDLRTPLAIVQGYTETLLIKHETLNIDEKKKYLENILESSKRLSGLVNQLFELSKLENDQVVIHKEPFHLGELVDNLVSRFEFLARSKDIKLTLNNIEKQPLAFGDISLVERVIQNLLENAIKFTDNGGSINIEVVNAKNDLQFKITDNGRGIAEENLTAIFQRFRTVKSNGEKVKSTGLGLAIANKIMELHNSTIRVTSKLNEGTSFYFKMPILTDS